MLKPVKAKQSGFTYFEAIIALIFIGIVAMLTLPGMIFTSSNSTALYRTKNMAAQIQEVSMGGRFGWSIMEKLKYVNKISSGNVNISLKPCTGQQASTCCTTMNPCYRFSDGGILRYDGYSNSAGGPGGIVYVNTMSYSYDPDGAGVIKPAELVYLHATGRIVSREVYWKDVIGSTNAGYKDPAYLKPWTKY